MGLFLAVRSVVHHAGPHVLEATLGPTACFLTGRALWGIDGALALALAWSGACLARRRLRAQDAGGLLIIGLTTLCLRAAVSLGLHSVRAYLLAPAVITAIMGVAFAASARSARPLLARVIADLVPRGWVDPADARVARLCRVGSVAWGVEQIVASLISLALIFQMSATTYLMVHTVVSWLVGAAVIGAVVPFYWSDLRALWLSRPLEGC